MPPTVTGKPPSEQTYHSLNRTVPWYLPLANSAVGEEGGAGGGIASSSSSSWSTAAGASTSIVTSVFGSSRVAASGSSSFAGSFSAVAVAGGHKGAQSEGSQSRHETKTFAPGVSLGRQPLQLRDLGKCEWGLSLMRSTQGVKMPASLSPKEHKQHAAEAHLDKVPRYALVA